MLPIFREETSLTAAGPNGKFKGRMENGNSWREGLKELGVSTVFYGLERMKLVFLKNFFFVNVQRDQKENDAFEWSWKRINELKSSQNDSFSLLFTAHCIFFFFFSNYLVCLFSSF